MIVVTDNDGRVESLKQKYRDYVGVDNIKVFFDTDEEYKTLEPQIVKSNLDKLTLLNKVLDTSDREGNPLDRDGLLQYMSNRNNKTECALRIFESEEEISLPKYITDAVE
jgi:putative ATP-dependent endonuclease of the OLD family